MIQRLEDGIAVIGGADGSTSLFMTGRIVDSYADIFWSAAIVLGLTALYFITAKNRNTGINRRAFGCSLAGTLCFVLGIASHIWNGARTEGDAFGYIETVVGGIYWSNF